MGLAEILAALLPVVIEKALELYEKSKQGLTAEEVEKELATLKEMIAKVKVVDAGIDGRIDGVT
jgi:hypothetical protein